MSATEIEPGAQPAREGNPVQLIEAQRTQIIKAMSIIEACRMGSDSMLAPLGGVDEPDFEGALAAAHEILDDVADELETAVKMIAPQKTG
ncbi:MAG TPA: hypothetical protein VGE08_03995 [Steroidobacter sp.]|uniref:hypothetical protein n=1 Tax=Steroidobacter sp. TaxID=1978227 RepID=UPI002ED771E6